MRFARSATVTKSRAPCSRVFLALLRGETPAKVVWTGDLDYWMAGQREAGTALDRMEYRG